MKFRTIGIFVLLSLMLYLHASSVENKIQLRQDVFISGRDGYNTFRIPALVASNNGVVLAFCEGRKSNSGDEGDIDLLLKRSFDDGATWSSQIIVHEEGGDAPITVGNPCPIVERNSDKIHLLFTRNNKRLFYTNSEDDGASWSTPKEFTEILKADDYDIVRIATGPGRGIQMRHGRLVAPIWVSNRERKDRNENPTKSRYRSGVVYSDDGGATWTMGSLVPPDLNRLNECTVVEKKDGSLLLNMRAHKVGFRAVSTSVDGGETWSNPVVDKKLPCPTCQASMIMVDNKLLFLNPAGEGRDHLTLRQSVDEGKTWTHAELINEGRSAYSDIAVTQNGNILCLFENGEEQYHEKISIVKIATDE